MENITLSYSSSNLLLGCEQKYVHYKVLETPKDPDFEDSFAAFNIGKAFHFILETSMHKKPESISSLLMAAKDEFNLEDNDLPLIHGMILKYLRGNKDDGLEAVFCEYKILHPIILGFIDVILKNAEGYWEICDLKTASTIYPATVKALNMNTQLNLYSYFFKDIAKDLGLDPKKFKGCRYRVVTKPKLKQKNTESYSDYVLRIANSAKYHDYVVPIADMKPKETFENHKELHKLAMTFHKGKATPKKNYNYCNSYFRACEYWSKCHGKCYSDIDVKDRASDD